LKESEYIELKEAWGNKYLKTISADADEFIIRDFRKFCEKNRKIFVKFTNILVKSFFEVLGRKKLQFCVMI